MKLSCSGCKSLERKTPDGMWITVKEDNWAGDFYVFCSEKCKEQNLSKLEKK